MRKGKEPKWTIEPDRYPDIDSFLWYTKLGIVEAWGADGDWRAAADFGSCKKKYTAKTIVAFVDKLIAEGGGHKC